MRGFVAASAVLSVAGTSFGFVVNNVGIQPNSSIAPSSGSFVVDATWLDANNILVSGSEQDWFDNEASIVGSTFLALDRAGGASGFSLNSNTKGGDPVVLPEWNAATGNSIGVITPGVDFGILNDGSAIAGGQAGIGWNAGPSGGFLAPSSVSLVNGASIDSIFVGNLSLTDSNASLVGADLFAKIDGQDVFLPLNGAPGTLGYRLEQERDRTYAGQVELFIVVPNPGAAGILGLAGFAAIRRRRA